AGHRIDEVRREAELLGERLTDLLRDRVDSPRNHSVGAVEHRGGLTLDEFLESVAGGRVPETERVLGDVSERRLELCVVEEIVDELVAQRVQRFLRQIRSRMEVLLVLLEDLLELVLLLVDQLREALT